MNPFRSLTRLHFRPTLFRWPPTRTCEMPVERPPRSKAPRGRIQIIWHGDASSPIPFEVEEPPRSDGLRLQPWF